MDNKRKGIILNVLSVAVMSITPIMNKFSLSTLNPLQASFLNAFFSTIITYIAIKSEKKNVEKLFADKQLWLLGITNTLGIILQYISVSFLDPVSVGLFGRFYIVFAILLSIVLLHERLNKLDIVPILLTIIGTILITDFSGSINSIVGVITAISYTFFFALTNMLAKKMVSSMDSKILLFYNQCMSAILLFLFLIVTNQEKMNLFNYGTLNILIAAFCSGFLGLYLFYEGLKYISFRSANLIRALNPVFVFLFSLPFFKIPLTINFVFGGILILVSVIWMSAANSK